MRRSEAEHAGAGATACSEPVTQVTRRTALAFGLSGCVALVEGCGGGGGSGDASPEPTGWNVGPLYLLVGSRATRDLAATLPVHVARGGKFEVSSAGAPLPRGMTLSASGILAVGNATAGTVDGVIFSYTEPAA